jgi:uncharacterized ParB-like nuclease family protein
MGARLKKGAADMFDGNIFLNASHSIIPLSIVGYGENKRAYKTAIQMYRHTMIAGAILKVVGKLTGRQVNLRDLSTDLSGRQVLSSRSDGIQSVPLARIKGSENRSSDFDGSFRPVKANTRQRWTGIAQAMILEQALPPVDLIQVGSDYYVRDGHHRVSAAKALGQVEIDAVVTVMRVSGGKQAAGPAVPAAGRAHQPQPLQVR